MLSACRINTSCWRGAGPLLASSGEPTGKKKLRPCAACTAHGNVSRRCLGWSPGRLAWGWVGPRNPNPASAAQQSPCWEGAWITRAQHVPWVMLREELAQKPVVPQSPRAPRRGSALVLSAGEIWGRMRVGVPQPHDGAILPRGQDAGQWPCKPTSTQPLQWVVQGWKRVGRRGGLCAAGHQGTLGTLGEEAHPSGRAKSPGIALAKHTHPGQTVLRGLSWAN